MSLRDPVIYDEMLIPHHSHEMGGGLELLLGREALRLEIAFELS